MGLPDADIHPVATGNAIHTVEEHQAPADVILYSGWFCPFVQRVWLALEEKGIPYQYKEENPYHKDPEFLKLSPKGLVPALVYNSRPIHESLIILEFLEEMFPDKKPLMPKDPYDKAQVRLAIDQVTKIILPNFFKILQAQEKKDQEAAREALYQSFSQFGDKIQGPFWGGVEVSLADLALIPWIGRLYIIEEHRGFDITKTSPKFQAWAEHVKAMPSFQKTTSERQHYAPIYGRYLRNEAQSGAAKAIRAGTVIP